MAFGAGSSNQNSPNVTHKGAYSTTKKQVKRDPSLSNIKVMTSNAELSIFESQLKMENEKRFKDELKKFMKQDEQLIVFNSSSPRFQDPATHQIRVLPGKDSISGINFRVKHDKPIGPGHYAHPDEIEKMVKVKRQLSHNAPVNVAFGSVQKRSANDFQS